VTTTILIVLGGLVLFGFVAAAILAATRGTPVSEVSARGDDAPPAAGDPLFQRTLEAYVGTTLRPGHEIVLCDCGDDTYPRLWADIRAARRYVAVQMYYAGAGRVADELHDALVDRARAGVEVLFLHDAFGSSLSREWLDSLRKAGVEVAKFRAFRPHMLHRLINRAHVRAIVVDGEVGWTGGFGIDDKWLGDGRHKGSWRDTNARFTGPAVSQLLATFGSCWAEATGELITGRRFWGAASETTEDAADDEGDGATRASGALAGVLHAPPTAGSTAAERLVALTVSGARRRLWLTNAYFVPDDDIRRFLKEAVRRGADVRVLAPGPSSDVRSTYLAARARYEELLEGGVRIWEYEPDMIHAKTMVVDGRWCVVGTMNMDNRSMAFNDECNLLVQDEGVAAVLERMFLGDLERSKEIDLESFRRRPWWQKGLELGAHGMSRIL
jgi:cardiolipin synthase